MNIFTRKKNKKASLQLSINAIVVLVMAMVVMGLGLGFVRGLFGQGQQNLVKVIDNNVLQNKASYDTPFTLDGKIKVSRGGSTALYMGIYNKANGDLTFESSATSCKNSKTNQPVLTGEGDDAAPVVVMTFPDNMKVSSGEAIGVQGSVYVSKDSTNPGDTYICEITVTSKGGSNDVGPTYTGSVFIESTGG